MGAIFAALSLTKMPPVRAALKGQTGWVKREANIAACGNEQRLGPAWLARSVHEKGLFQAQNPVRQLFGFGVFHLRIGRHGNGAPHAAAACHDFGRKHGRCCFIASVFGGNIFQGGSHHFVVYRMAGQAVFGLCQFIAGQGGGDQANAKQGGGHHTFHGVTF